MQPDASSGSAATVLYDADCGFCQACVDWTTPRLREPRPRFAPLDSPEGRSWLEARNVPAGTDGVVMVQAVATLTRSDAVLALLGRCRFPWSLAGHLIRIPRPLRDGLYDLVARNRHRLTDRSCPTR